MPCKEGPYIAKAPRNKPAKKFSAVTSALHNPLFKGLMPVFSVHLKEYCVTTNKFQKT